MNTDEKKQPQIFPEVRPEDEEFLNKMSDYFYNDIPKVEDKPIGSLQYLHHYMVQTRDLFRALERPWAKLIPLVHRGSSLSMLSTQTEINPKKHVRLTTDLISTMCYLNRNQNVIHRMSVFYSQQVQLLENLLRQKDIEVTAMDTESVDDD